MARPTELRWTCDECGDEFESSIGTFGLDSCDCGAAWVDHDRHTLRRSKAAVRL